MKHVMKNLWIIALLTLVNTSATGCNSRILPRRLEISDLRLVQVIGIDKPDALSGYHTLTIASKKLTESGSQESQDSGDTKTGGNKSVVDTAVGATLFEAVRNIQTHSDRVIFWGHVKYFLIGENAAKENIARYIDFFTRDHEFHIDAKVYIVRGTAKDLIEQMNKSDFFIIDKLDNLERMVDLLSISEAMKLSELMRFIDVHSGSARVPCIELVQREGSSGIIVLDIETSGYAVFTDLKLSAYIGRDIARGVNLIANTVGSTVVLVKDLNGEEVSLEVTSSRTEVIPRFNGDELDEVLLKTKVTCNLGEIRSQSKTFFEKNFEYMESQLNEALKKDMMRVLNVVTEAESDCLGICDAIRMKHPIKWHRIEPNWINIMPRLRFQIQVESNIERSYELNEPDGYRGTT